MGLLKTPDYSFKNEVPLSEVMDLVANKNLRQSQLNTQDQNRRQQQFEDIRQVVSDASGTVQQMVQASVIRQHANAVKVLGSLLARGNEPTPAPDAISGPQPAGAGAFGPQPEGTLNQPAPISLGETPGYQAALRSAAFQVNPTEGSKAIIDSLYPKAPTTLEALAARSLASGRPVDPAIAATKQSLAKPPPEKQMTNLWQDPKSGKISPSEQPGWIKRTLPQTNATALLSTAYANAQRIDKPTASTKSSAEFATTIIPHIDEMRQLIAEADANGYIGPAAGRVYNQFMAGKVGTTGDVEADKLLGKIRAYDSLLKTGAMRVHFGSRGGSNMYDHFSDMLNSGKQSAALLNGSLDGIEAFMQGYADAGKPGSPTKNKSVMPAQDDAALKASVRKKLGLSNDKN